MQCIYKIENQVNHKVYIGKTSNYERRKQDHIRLSEKLDHKESNKSLYQAIRKYGLNNFSFSVVEELKDYSIASEREMFWINHYDSYYNGYNETFGGDGGSPKGHCTNEDNGRAKMTIEEIKDIRTKYSQGFARNEVYALYQDKISLSGFARIWQGKTWSNIMPEVYTEKQKIINQKKGWSQSSKSQRIYTEEEVRQIRLLKQQGIPRKEVFEKYGKGSINTFQDLWYGKTYKEIQ